MRSSFVALGAAAALVPSLLSAQQRLAAEGQRDGSWELSISAGLVGLGSAVPDIEPAKYAFVPGGQLRIGYNLGRSLNLGVGASAGFGKSRTASMTAYLFPFAALTLTPNINARTSPFFSLGGGIFARQSPSASSPGLQVGAGIRQMMGEALALRIEGDLQYVPKLGTVSTTGAGLFSVGLSYFMGGGGGGPVLDSDGDGVPDRRDRCPNTPRGAVVDARGCPVDSDHDGVPDGLDRCPGTPSGVTVDASGCPLDSDHDGVPDYLDRCANTPAGVAVDANGCPPDSDGDGVPDYLDRCPNTPAGVAVDANGCPPDSDHDGVADYLDRCPNTPAGMRVDANGCPVERDTDGDGVPDSRDKCPNTPRRVRVDEDGCPLATLPPVNMEMVVRNVSFQGNGAVLPAAARTEMDRIAIAIRATPNSRWEIAGHTNTVGNAARNLRLSQQRADAVRAYLIFRGVPAASLTAVGYGGRRPIASNRTAAGRRMNMRVSIKRLQ